MKTTALFKSKTAPAKAAKATPAKKVAKAPAKSGAKKTGGWLGTGSQVGEGRGSQAYLNLTPTEPPCTAGSRPHSHAAPSPDLSGGRRTWS